MTCYWTYGELTQTPMSIWSEETSASVPQHYQVCTSLYHLIFIFAHQNKPVLALMSRNEMSACSETHLSVVSAMYNSMIQGKIDVDDVGEVTAAFILLFIMDKIQLLKA